LTDSQLNYTYKTYTTPCHNTKQISNPTYRQTDWQIPCLQTLFAAGLRYD